MRRLFSGLSSNFSNGAAGAGLLLLRAAAATSLIAPAVHMVEGSASAVSVVGMLSAANGLLLGMGLWTHAAGAIGAVLALLNAAASGHSADGLMAAAVSAALALLGPGAWSIDARLFGWKRIELAPRKGDGPTCD